MANTYQPLATADLSKLTVSGGNTGLTGLGIKAKSKDDTLKPIPTVLPKGQVSTKQPNGGAVDFSKISVTGDTPMPSPWYGGTSANAPKPPSSPFSVAGSGSSYDKVMADLNKPILATKDQSKNQNNSSVDTSTGAGGRALSEGTPAGNQKPTTNPDGSFTDSNGVVHTANSPEAVNNRTMGTNAPVPSATPPVVPTTPATPTNNNSTNFSDTQKGLYNASAGSYNSGTGTVAGGLGLTASAFNNPNPNIASAQSGLLGIAQNQTPAVQQANANLLKFQKENPYMIAAQSNPNVAADVASGRSGLLGQTFGKEEQALTTAQANAQAGQGQQITAGNEAGSQALTGQSQQTTAGTNIANTGTTQQQQGITGLGTAGGLIPETLRYGNITSSGGTGSGFLDTQVEQALQNMSTGASTQDATKEIAGNPLAMMSFQSKMRGFDSNWNPTSSNAIATANMQNFAKATAQAVEIQQGLTALTSVANNLIPNIGTTGFNPMDTPIGNETFHVYFTNSNPAAAAGIQRGLKDIQTQISNVIAANTGMTPTGVTDQMTQQGVNFENMNPQQLSDFMKYVYSYAQSNMGAIQNTIKGTTGGYGVYQGTTANDQGLPNPKANPLPHAIEGTAGSVARDFISGIMSAVSGAASAGVGGAAGSAIGSKLFGSTAAAVLM
jgi:hypothetical protein